MVGSFDLEAPAVHLETICSALSVVTNKEYPLIRNIH